MQKYDCINKPTINQVKSKLSGCKFDDSMNKKIFLTNKRLQYLELFVGDIGVRLDELNEVLQQKLV